MKSSTSNREVFYVPLKNPELVKIGSGRGAGGRRIVGSGAGGEKAGEVSDSAEGW